jgi:hypothetical protein
MLAGGNRGESSVVVAAYGAMEIARRRFWLTSTALPANDLLAGR